MESDIKISDKEEARFQSHIAQMKRFLSDGDIHSALKEAKLAMKIRGSIKLERKIMKMEDYLLELEENSEGEDVVELCKNFFIPKQLDDHLYPYQRAGVAWMYQLFDKNKGGILADDMGLGKTLQTITFLTGLFDMNKVSHVIIILPATLISNWTAEFEKWSPLLEVREYHGEYNSRQRELASVQRKGGIIITTYGLATTSFEDLSRFRGREFVWDYAILDEGHKIKNPTKSRTAVNNIPAKNRLILTGTPIQNNLMEMWSLFDFVQHGTLLGTSKTFKSEYEIPIHRSREKNASINEKKFGEEMARQLMKRVGPYLLRRTKAEILEKLSDKNCNSESKNSKVPKQLNRKNDLVIWLELSEHQIRIYHDFLHLDRVKEILMTKRSPLVELTVLKKLCDHPRLLSAAACNQLGLDGDQSFGEDDRGGNLLLDHVTDQTLLNESGKLKFLLKLMANLKSEGHRVLIFSQSRKMLDIIQRILKNNGFRLLRLDGTIINQKDRQHIIQKFETNDSFTALLLTVQVGGVGLNLTAADRVIIFDPSWNPASDSQAVDRAYRIGQERSVVVYRFITCSTVEEKIYRRQVFKESIYKETTGGQQNTYRYFTSTELKDMFTLENPHESLTQIQLEQLHFGQRKTSIDLDEHIAQLYSFGIFGISDNDLLFTVKATDDEPIDVEEVQRIGTKIERANKLMELECQLTEKARVDRGMFTTPSMPGCEILPRTKKQVSTEIDFVKPNVPAKTVGTNKGSRAPPDDGYDDLKKVTNDLSELNVVDKYVETPLVNQFCNQQFVSPVKRTERYDKDISIVYDSLKSNKTSEKENLMLASKLVDNANSEVKRDRAQLDPEPDLKTSSPAYKLHCLESTCMPPMFGNQTLIEEEMAERKDFRLESSTPFLSHLSTKSNSLASVVVGDGSKNDSVKNLEANTVFEDEAVKESISVILNSPLGTPGDGGNKIEHTGGISVVVLDDTDEMSSDDKVLRNNETDDKDRSSSVSLENDERSSVISLENDERSSVISLEDEERSSVISLDDDDKSIPVNRGDDDQSNQSLPDIISSEDSESDEDSGDNSSQSVDCVNESDIYDRRESDEHSIVYDDDDNNVAERQSSSASKTSLSEVSSDSGSCYQSVSGSASNTDNHEDSMRYASKFRRKSLLTRVVKRVDSDED